MLNSLPFHPISKFSVQLNQLAVYAVSGHLSLLRSDDPAAGSDVIIVESLLCKTNPHRTDRHFNYIKKSLPPP